MSIFSRIFDPIIQEFRWMTGNSVCFVRGYQTGAEFRRKLRVTSDELWRLNPQLNVFDEFYGGQVLLLPNRVHNYPREEFTLTPWPLRVEDFRTFPRQQRFMDLKWQPPHAPFSPITGTASKEATWGRFEYKDAASGDDIIITDGWEGSNIGSVEIPGLKGISQGGKPAGGKMRFNKKCHNQLVGLWTDWDRHGLTKHILTFDGAFVPRYMRKSTHVRANLSNHSWGTAFDINASQNPLGKTPAALGAPGSVLDMAELAYKWGFFWGGYFGGGRNDGMHFEVAKIL